MSALDRTALKAKIETQVYENANGEVTAAMIQEVLKDMTDSNLNKVTDASLLQGLSAYNAARSYATGEGCLNGGDLYQANKPTTGAFKSADWDLITVDPVIPPSGSTTGIVLTDVRRFVYEPAGMNVLATIDMSENPLNAAGQVLRLKAFGKYAANTNSKTVRVSLNATNMDFVTTQNGGGWSIELIAIATESEFNMLFAANGQFVGDFTEASNPFEAFTLRVWAEATASGDVELNGYVIEKLDTI